ncbi:hypothetical protein D3C85_1452740 [compost metagenome]
MTSGASSILASAAFSRSTTAAGVPVGASTPNVELTSSAGMPASVAEGTSGSIEIRAGAATASARNCPDLMNGSEAGAVSTIMFTCPATRSVIAGPLPL